MITPPRILVVDDNFINQLLIKAVLDREGFVVDLAASASDALNSIGVRRPDLILMDIQLPGQDGLSLTRELKARAATSALPIVALTAHAMPGVVEACRMAGCTGYIAKPIDTRALGPTVRGYLAVGAKA